MKIPGMTLTNKEFYTMAFYWGVFAACNAIGFVTLLFSFVVWPFSLRAVSLMCFTVGMIALYHRKNVLKSKQKGDRR